MLRLKGHKKNGSNMNVWTDKAATSIAALGIRVQRKFSTAMNRVFSKMPIRKLKLLLIAFCILSGGYSIYLAVNAVAGPAKTMGNIKVEGVNIPKHIDQSDSEVSMTKQYVTDEMYQEIQDYKRYMDSIGHPIRKSLVDSISILEEIYHSQTIK